jgi:opacity protein-like surface antigen
MKLTFVICGAALALLAAVQPAASQPAAAPGGFYVEGVAQSAFGTVTSQSFGAEAGVLVAPKVVVFAEFGHVRDASPSEVGINAQLIAGYLASTQSASVNYSVHQPVNFGLAGIKYLIPYTATIEPYVLGGFGIARYTRDVHFTVGGTDVTSNLAPYGVTLGADLAGSTTKPMLTAGGGVVWTVKAPFFVDFQFRYGRIFAEGKGFNVSRAGIGLGIRF